MKASFLATVVFLCVAPTWTTPTAAQEAAPAAKTPSARAEEFLTRVGKGEVDAAVDDLTKGSFLQGKTTELAALKGQIKTLVSVFGASLGFELAREVKTKDSVLHLVYLGKQENIPLVWHFYFYKPKGEWRLSGVFVNDQLQGLEG